ncbi:hypothetical protein GCM10010232_50110 [Streptomyces amakusaensis]|uniref:Uncharacterized protein n=1 Tax=Streptomyces amakusaensis TaxID=67271 RepID=A0ABW0AMT4_9ACTN
MAQKVSEQHLKPWVDFFGLCLQEADGEGVPVRWPGEREMDGEFLIAREGRIDLESAGHTHQAAMTVEVWDAEPPADLPGEWDAEAEAELFSLSGRLRVWAVTYGPDEESVELGRAGVRWRVRVRCAGRTRVAELAPLEEVEEVEGVEQYVVQMWPCA